MTNCVDTFLIQSFLDGELSSADLREFEIHVAECKECGLRLDEERRFLEMVRDQCGPIETPPMLARSIGQCLDEEDRLHRREVKNRIWNWALPGTSAAVAMAALLLFVASTVSPGSHDSEVKASDDAVMAHMRRSPMEVQGAAVSPWLNKHFRRNLNVPAFNQQNVAMKGARLSQIQRRAAAQLYFKATVGGRNYEIQVHVFDARGLKRLGGRRIRVDGVTLWVGSRRGIQSVSFVDRQGSAYVFTSRLNSRLLITFVRGSNIWP